VRHGTAREREIADPGVEREEDDLRRGKVGAKHPCDLEAGHSGHRVVEDQQVRPELESLPRRLIPVGGLAHHLEVGVRLHERAEAAADREMVIGDENAPGHDE
jgi:hypothetical protein